MTGVVVVGAGVFGTWTAFHLMRAGARVTLVEASSPGHSRSSSGDETRIVRCGYGADAIYSEMARQSLVQWQELHHRLGTPAAPLLHRCGVLWLTADDDAYTTATRETLVAAGHDVALLDRERLASRFPAFDLTGLSNALFEPTAGIVMARRSVRALALDLARQGVAIVHASVEPPATGRLSAIRSVDGRTIRGERFVFACGPWLPRLFPSILEGRIRPTRQVVTYFATPPGDDRFGVDAWPAWIDFPSGIYGTPDVEGRGIKVGIDEHGPPIDPETSDRLADPASIAKARAWLARRVPALANAPVSETRVCQYENTATGDFLIDRHPAIENAWIVGGGSGHGFKHGPAVGDLAARMVLGGEAPGARFALAAKTADARRAVY